MRENYIFTSESVSEGHPDKICDQISDAILDELLKANVSDANNVRCACETLVKDDYILCAGEVSHKISHERAERVIRDVICDIGYDDKASEACGGFSASSCQIDIRLGEQSQDIAQGVNRSESSEQGAGDQGLMFGYACNETEHYMPAPIYYAHQLVQQHARVRKAGEVDFFLPDAKSQVTLEYANGEPLAIKTIVFSTHHREYGTLDEVKEAVMETIIKPICPSAWLPKDDDGILINPTGRFVIGGPKGDCGLTGRKIIVDTYGGMARHGGGAFSGKDPSKVDRSAAYMARYVAKNIVVSGLAEKCEIQLAYAIGKAEPVSMMVDTFGTGTLPDSEIEKRVNLCFDFTPHDIIHKMLDLIRPIYQPTASYGHFGRAQFPWEQCDKAEDLK